MQSGLLNTATVSPDVEAGEGMSRLLAQNSAWTEYPLSVAEVRIAENMREEDVVEVFTKLWEDRLPRNEVTAQNIRQ